MAKIIIADDAAFMRMVLKNMLERYGHEVVAEADNGLAAVEKYKENKPDLVTMDITMPDMDGIEAVQKIMSMDPNAKVIMCSAMGQQGMVLDAVKAGAKDFIIKPFQEERVISSIEKVLHG